jgi:hypothetical protein
MDVKLFMYPWQDFKIEAAYDNKVTVQVLSVENNFYIVKYKEEVFKCTRQNLVFRKKK